MLHFTKRTLYIRTLRKTYAEIDSSRITRQPATLQHVNTWKDGTIRQKKRFKRRAERFCDKTGQTFWRERFCLFAALKLYFFLRLDLESN
jgi:hypothetical protein